MKTKLLHELHSSLVELDYEQAICIAKRIVMTGMPVLDVVEKALLPAVDEFSSRFDAGEIFIPQMIVAADTFEEVSKIITDGIKPGKEDNIVAGKVLMYTVKGDIHDIGKNIMNSVLKINGFAILDLGRNVSAEQVVEAASTWQPDVIIGFALMSTTFPEQKALIDLLEELGVRNKYSILVGGALASEEWAEVIGADGYAGSVVEAARLAHSIAAKNRFSA